VHAYVLMPNHVHLLLTPVHGDSLPRLMQSLGRRYVRAVNAAHGRSGSLWEGRYRAAPIDPVHLVDCCRYIELNPARAGMVRHARQHRWSSYRGNALGEADPVLVPHARQIALGVAAYRALCERPLEAGFIAAVRAATNGGWALGDAAFQARIAAATGRRAAPLPRGRPRKIAPAAATGASIDE
jgi:putative transposase